MMKLYNLQSHEQTNQFLKLFIRAEINEIDVGILNRSNSKMRNFYSLTTASCENILKKCRYDNWKNNCDIFIRPARNSLAKIIFADDILPETAFDFACTYKTICVNTSVEGGYQIWILTENSNTTHERLELQRQIVPLLAADLGSVSGEHYGRLPGFKNHKRGGCWVNLKAASGGNFWKHENTITEISLTQNRSTTHAQSNNNSPSEAEFGFACHSLRAGIEANSIIQNITERARLRNKKHAEAYAIKTVEKAAQVII